MSSSIRPTLRHVPALDGLRGLAVAGVVAYHAGFDWAVGGYLGVSAFFTLSGYLITSLLLVEWEATGGISLRGFWSRRFRRLLPAALALLGAVVVASSFLADGSQLADLRGDVTAALGYVANWHFVLEDRSYGESFAGPSPLQHLWSLAIEEQFYVVFPLVALGLLWLGRGRRSVLAVAFGAATVASVAWSLHLGSATRAYFDTGARAVEILVGVLLALFLTGRPQRLETRPRSVAAAGVVGLVLMFVAWATVPHTSALVTSGGLAVHAVLMASVLAAAHVRGPVRAVCATRPLRMVGRVSYGLYLFHWPVFVWVDEARLGVDGPALFAVRMAITAALTAASFHLVEQPIRQRRALVGRRAPAIGFAGATAVVVLAVAVGSIRPPTDDVSSVLDALPVAAAAPSASSSDGPTLLAAAAPEAPGADAVDDVLLLGDSLMSQVSERLMGAFADEGIRAEYAGGPGTGPLSPQGSWATQVDAWVPAISPDVVVIAACCNYTMSTVERYVGPDGDVVEPGDPAVLPAWEHEMLDIIERATADGARVLLVRAAPVETNGFYGPLEEHVQGLNLLYDSIAAADAAVTILDWADVLAPDGNFTWDLPGADGEAIRVRLADGVHLTDHGISLVTEATLAAVLDRSDA